ncbi:hypothetical protein NEDG_02159 [Nematocida displodere]|uniref:Kinesin motor domain-containing protein n=1 Tax=Nematocida displodere TaxID=1805483 RepID=A0A177EFM6_9MICR|nr:hypothetical protein NEDG_02159 [Nematocida displodere]
MRAFSSGRINTILGRMEDHTANLKTSAEKEQSNIYNILTQNTSKYTGTQELQEEIDYLKEQLELVQKSAPKEAAPQERALREELIAQEAAFKAYREQSSQKIREQQRELLELKGQIRVICRVKPFLSKEEVVLRDRSIGLPGRGLTFGFTNVLAPAATQKETFAEINDLIQAVVMGYRVSLLAYGPTGSGKTYTMEGSSTSEGIVQRSLKLLEREVKHLLGQKWECTTKISIQELYNDKLVGLAPEEWMEVSLGAIEGLFAKASAERRTGGTECNQRSSRSHLILRVGLELTRNATHHESISGALCIVDLAGSERLGHSLAQGLRMKEAVEINKSLTALGDVVVAISSQAQHIPYRNSKLTQILKDTLGPGAKTAFIINVDLQDSYLNEAVVALRFAKRLQECSLGRSVIASTQTSGRLGRM